MKLVDVVNRRSFSIVGLALFLSFIVLPTSAQAQFPNAPQNVTASDDQFPDRIRVSWTAPIGGAQSGYHLFRSTANQVCPGTSINTGILGAATSFDDTTAVPGTVYYYSLRAFYPIGGGTTGNCSNTDSGRIEEPPAPNPPVVAATDGTLTDRVEVVFQHPSSGSSAVSFNVFRSTNPIGLCGEINSNNDPASTQLAQDLEASSSPQLFTDNSATPGVQYYYTMQSIGIAPGSKPSTCSNIDPGHARVSPPTNIQASDGTFEEKVEVKWAPPALGGAITGYDLYRSTTQVGCETLLASNLPTTPLVFNDTTATPGVVYYYSFKSKASLGASDCSVIDPGHRRIKSPLNVSATDGAFPNKVNVTWQPNPSPGETSGYNLFKDTTATSCQVSLQQNLTAGTTLFVDTQVVPGTIYYYSVQTVSPAGVSSCSNVDPGHAVTACSDGLDNDNDSKIDFPSDPGCSSPNDPDETDLPVCSDGLDNDGDGFVDFSGGDPGCSSAQDNDEHDPALICDNGLDDDQDGIADFKANGSGDPGCDSPTDSSEDDEALPLKSPAFAKFNTYLGQQVFSELINQGTKAKEVGITIYNLRGEVMITRFVVVPPQSQVDLDINSLVKFACDVLQQGCSGFEDLSATRNAPNGLGRPDGVVDTYGLVRFDFVDGDPDQRLLGRMSFYRTNKDGNFSFAFAREFRNPNTGTTFAVSNTYDPRALGNLVPNWAEVIAFGKRNSAGLFDFSAQGFTINIYDQEGALRDTRKIILPGLGEFDLQAGHEFVDGSGKVIESVYLVEVIPDDPEAEYFLTVSRYSSNSPQGVDPETYNFAFSIEGQPGTGEKLYAPICNQVDSLQGLNGQPFVFDWVEVACVSATSCQALVKFRNVQGVVVADQNASFEPKAQFHFNASAVLPKGDCGSVEIEVLQGKVASQSMFYIQGLDGSLQTGFASPARPKGREVQVGSINTFLGMQNVFTLVSTSDKAASATFLIRSFDGKQYPGLIDLDRGASSAVGISSAGELKVPSNTYGSLMLSTQGDGEVVADVWRIRVNSRGELDFVMPTAVR